MSGFSDGGGGSFGSGFNFGPAINNISNSIKKTAKKTVKKAPPKPPKRTYTPPKRPTNNHNNNRNYQPPRPTKPKYSAPPRPTPPRPPVGNTSTGTIAPTKPAPAPKPITLEEYLAKDTVYQGQTSAYQKALKDYAAQFAAEQGKYTNEYGASLQKLNTEKTEGAANLQDDFAGRGLLQSGVYVDALNDYNSGYATKQADLERAKQAYMADLGTDNTNFKTQQDLALQKAKQDAANRRIASLGI